MTDEQLPSLSKAAPEVVSPHPGIEGSLEHRFAILKDAVLAKRPVLKEIVRKRGSMKLLDYARDYVDVNLNPTIPRRQHELFSVVHAIVKERFNVELADSVIKQMERYYFVSTADHTGPIVSSFFLNSNLLTAAAMTDHPDPVLQNVVVFSCANISVDNHTFPRGLYFNNFINDTLEVVRLPFFSGNMRPPTIYTMRPYTREDLGKVYHILKVKFAKNQISKAVYDKIVTLLKEVYDTDEVLACTSYVEQISKTNYALWPKLLGESKPQLPGLIYLELEDVVRKLIINFHLNEDTIINHILFDPEYEFYINTYFEDIFGSFSRKDSTGTYLFWAMPPGSRYKQQLWRKGDFLVSKDESYKIALKPEAIKNALESKELIPGLLLAFITVSFYYGLKCLGGFNQVNYLTLMKNGYIRMNVDLGNYRSIEVCARAQTKEICDGLSLAFLGYNKSKMTLASGLDLYLYNDKDSWDKMMKIAKDISIEEALNPQMPEIYRISYDQQQWDPSLIDISDNDISKLTELDKKIIPSAWIHG